MVNKQDYLNSFNQDIDMVRGDTLCFDFQLMGLGSRQEYEDLEVIFAVADRYDGSIMLVSENDNGINLEEYDAATDTATFSVTVIPEKTIELDLSRYFYDLKIKTSDDVVTLMRGYFTLLFETRKG